MANVVINDTYLTNIAEAIRGKNGKSTQYKPSEMASAITYLPTGTGGGSAEVIFMPNTYKQISATSLSSWKNTYINNKVPLSYDLTAYGINPDWSNFVSLYFVYAYYSYQNKAQAYGVALLYKEDGKLKLINRDTGGGLYGNGVTNENVNNISFTKSWNTDTYKASEAENQHANHEIDVNEFPANNVTFYSRYQYSTTSLDYGDCVAFFGGQLIKLV